MYPHALNKDRIAHTQVRCLSHAFRLFLKIFFPKRGKKRETFIVALEGVDGVGKTSHAKKLVIDFRTRGLELYMCGAQAQSLL